MWFCRFCFMKQKKRSMMWLREVNIYLKYLDEGAQCWLCVVPDILSSSGIGPYGNELKRKYAGRQYLSSITKFCRVLKAAFVNDLGTSE